MSKNITPTHTKGPVESSISITLTKRWPSPPIKRKITISIKKLRDRDFAETKIRTITFNTKFVT